MDLHARDCNRRESFGIPCIQSRSQRCTHLLNILSGDEVLNALVNTVFASAFGVVFGVLFTMSGNVWPIVILHFLYDYLAFTCTSSDDMPASIVYLEVVAFVIIAIIYVAILMKKKGDVLPHLRLTV